MADDQDRKPFYCGTFYCRTKLGEIGGTDAVVWRRCPDCRAMNKAVYRPTDERPLRVEVTEPATKGRV